MRTIITVFYVYLNFHLYSSILLVNESIIYRWSSSFSVEYLIVPRSSQSLLSIKEFNNLSNSVVVICLFVLILAFTSNQLCFVSFVVSIYYFPPFNSKISFYHLCKMYKFNPSSV